MGYPTASSTPSMSGVYIPEIWSGKLLEKFYPTTVFGSIANTDYEGEISAYGDKVFIRTIPNMIVRKYVKGQPLIADTPEGGKRELRIDQGWYYNVAINKVDQKQSDIAFMDKWGEDASEQIKIRQDSDILANIYADAAPANSGATAGKIAGDINLGVTGTPLALDKSNIVDKIVECGQVMTEQDRPTTNRWMVLPAWANTRVLTSELKDASLTGDGKSTLRNGRIGIIDNWEIFISNNLPWVVDGGKRCFYCPFGHKSALTYAAQFVENEIIPNQNDFGQLMRGLIVYGYEVIDPDSLGVMYARAA